MEVVDTVIRNLLTLFGDHSSQTPLAPGIFMRLNIAKRSTYNSVHITSHLLLKQRQYNKVHDDISFQTIRRSTCKKKRSKSEHKFCQTLKPYKCKMDRSHMRRNILIKHASKVGYEKNIYCLYNLVVICVSILEIGM